ncbi:MAG: glycosyltransferase [Methanoregulaceae archaeon]|nr:MAG: glycosyltransferase [Methanoregulaceae archaeon]
MKKFALVSLGLPPSQSGQSMVLYHLLKTIPPDAYCLITLRNFHLYHYLKQCSNRLGGRYYFLAPDYQFVRHLVKAASLLSLRSLLSFTLKLRVRQIKKILVQEHVQVVIACTGDLFDPPAAFLAANEMGIPVILYAFDYYSRQWTEPATRSFAEEFEDRILRKAAQIIVPNECMAKEYTTRYGVRPVVIHNPFDLEEYEKNVQANADKTTLESGTDGDVRIVYTGAVYDAHYSAFHNLIKAIPKTGIPGLILHIFTPQSPGQLQAHGISGPVRIHKPRPNSEIPALQRAADILFLPLAFNSPYPDIIRTSAPGKVGEYLAAKKPILVHAPEDSFISWFFLKNRCGEVVSEDSPEKLADSIIRLLRDGRYRQELSRNAYQIAKNDFDTVSAREKLVTLINNATVSSQPV